MPFIGETLRALDIQSGTALDAFSGTASVGAFLKQKGFEVQACDLMTYAYVFAQAYVVTDAYPTFDELFARDKGLTSVINTNAFRAHFETRYASSDDLFGVATTTAVEALQKVCVYLDTFLPHVDGFIATHFSNDEGSSDRMFFTKENGRRIDSIRKKLHEWRIDGWINDREFYVLLASLIEAADAVANTTGVYAAWVKTLQSNARRPLALVPPNLIAGTGLRCRAYQRDVVEIMKDMEPVDLLYLDPPYTTRQYSAYYHVPELIAKGWFDTAPDLRGKTGLIEDSDKKSDWATTSGATRALRTLLSSAKAKHVLLSYNNEGVIPAQDVENVMREFSKPNSYQLFTTMYGRYKADREHAARRYKADSVIEQIHAIKLR